MTSRPGKLWQLALIASALAVSGCERRAGSGGGAEPKHGTASVGGTVVSTVDGEPITLGEVEALVRATQLEPREALARLQSERLLMREAQRRGVSAHAIDVGTRRAVVQALLDAEAAAMTVSDGELREAYAKDARFRAPERRKSIHVLAKVKAKATPEQDAAARKVIERVIEELKREDAMAIHRLYKQKREGEVELKSDDIPPAARDAPLVDEYLSALFSLSSPGVVPQPVRTKFGWHAIAVTQFLPAFQTPFEEVAAGLRDEMLLRRREARVKELLTELQAKYGVSIEDDVNARLAALAE